MKRKLKQNLIPHFLSALNYIFAVGYLVFNEIAESTKIFIQ
jgi:hypothetical protein